MTGNNASIEVHGPAARSVADSAIASLGFDPDDVTSIRVDLTTENGAETETQFEARGPKAGAIAAAMIGAVDHEEMPPSSIEVELSANAPDDDGGTEEDEAGNGADEATADIPVADDPDADDLSKMTAGTNGHLGLSAVAAYYTKVTTPAEDEAAGGGSGGGADVPGVSVAQLLRTVEQPLDNRRLSDALNDSAHNNGVLNVETVETEGPGQRAYYSLTSLGVSFLQVHGAHEDVGDPITAVVGDPGDTDIEEYERLRQARQDGEHASGYRSPGSGSMNDEPDVDGPKPVPVGTRKHQALVTLREYHAAAGDDEWATARELFEFSGYDFPSFESFTAPLSLTFRQYALVERRGTGMENGGKKAEYRLNDAGRAELSRHEDPPK